MTDYKDHPAYKQGYEDGAEYVIEWVDDNIGKFEDIGNPDDDNPDYERGYEEGAERVVQNVVDGINNFDLYLENPHLDRVGHDPNFVSTRH